MKFTPDHNKVVSITLINPRLSFYAQPEYDIKIRVKNTLNNGETEVKSITLPDYTTNTPKYKATTEAANLVTSIALKFIDENRLDLEKTASKIISVLNKPDINYINSFTQLALR
ncbi:MAG: hypothetical protein PHC75_07980 [Burkholderiales bacterium]|nr:hypothetical protein [Burkholderiales bacterium]